MEALDARETLQQQVQTSQETNTNMKAKTEPLGKRKHKLTNY